MNPTNTVQNTIPEWPQEKKKNNRAVLMSVAAIVLVLSAAFGAFYITRSLNQASVPNAPESAPFAKWTPTKAKIEKGDDPNCPQGCGFGEVCVAGRGCRKEGGNADPNPQPTVYSCNATNCPGPCFSCNASKTSCISNGCEGVSSSGKAGKDLATASTVAPTNASGGVINMCGSGCAPENCHCLGGDACTDYECRDDLRTSCSRQGRSWCVNMHGQGMTCCAAGYDCNPSGNGCVGSGTKTTVKTTDDNPTVTTTKNPTTTVTVTTTVSPTITVTITTTPTATPTATLTVAPTPVGCNYACTDDEDCSTGLVCDPDSDRCRKPECTTASSCVCPTATTTPEPTPLGCNHACTDDDDCESGLACDTNSDRCRKPSCMNSSSCTCSKATPTDEDEPETTRRVTRTSQRTQPTALPEAGILDLPGVAAFGGGLLLAIIGILLAL